MLTVLYRLDLCIFMEDCLFYDCSILDLHTFSPVLNDKYAVVNDKRWVYFGEWTTVEGVEYFVAVSSTDQ